MELTILQQIILGVVQGITEWLPISSSAALTLIMSNYFGITELGPLITTSLFFHLGTFLAALIYFRKDVLKLIQTLFNYKYSQEESKNTLKFLIISTIISGILGLIILIALYSFQGELEFTGKTISLLVGVLLLFTGIIQIKIKNRGLRTEKNLKKSDSILAGIAQGFSSLPGLSRSGVTTSTLLLKKLDDTTALRLSFLMSLPVVFLGNIFLNLEDIIYTPQSLYGLTTAFVFGLITIHGLMRLSKKINFGWFVLVFAVLMILSVLI